MKTPAGVRVAALNGLIETKQGRWVTLDINVPWRLTGLNKKTMRRGRFSLPIRSVEESTLPIRRIMGQCVIVRAEMMFMTGNIDYHATSWRFREVQEGCVIPVYEWIWCETEGQLTAREISA